MKQKKKILVIMGTRPEAIKLIPVYQELKKIKTVSTFLISTGQHREMIESIFYFFNVRPYKNLEVMRLNQNLDELTATLIKSCSYLFQELKPDLVIVQGDTTTAMAATISSFYQRIKVAHVEAGLRSYNIDAPFPEEVNRRIISQIASFHFAPTYLAAKALKSERVPGIIRVTGNTVIDSLLIAKRKVRLSKKKFEGLYVKELGNYKRVVLITGHRRENFGKGFLNICKAIMTLSRSYPDVSFIYPVHLNPNVRNSVFEHLKNLPNVFLIDPVPYDHIVYLMDRSYIILTDSGGIQEEGPTLGKPVVIMRDVTERPEGVIAGCNILAGTARTKIVKICKELLDDHKHYKKVANVINPYGKGNSAKKIVTILKKELITK